MRFIPTGGIISLCQAVVTIGLHYIISLWSSLSPPPLRHRKLFLVLSEACLCDTAIIYKSAYFLHDVLKIQLHCAQRRTDSVTVLYKRTHFGTVIAQPCKPWWNQFNWFYQKQCCGDLALFIIIAALNSKKKAVQIELAYCIIILVRYVLFCMLFYIFQNVCIYIICSV